MALPSLPRPLRVRHVVLLPAGVRPARRPGCLGRQAPARAAPRGHGAARPGPNGDELWLRFCRAFRIDPAWAPLDSERDNRSLGIAETSLLRKLNRRLELGVWRDPVYDALIRELLAQEVLVARDADPVRLPPHRFDFAEQEGEVWIDWIKSSGVDVVGDVDDLRPRRPAEDAKWKDPDRVRAKLGSVPRSTRCPR